MQIEKYELYSVFEEQYFKPLKNDREMLLRGQYRVRQLPEYYNGAVVSFVDSSSRTWRKISDQENIITYEIPHGYLDNIVKTHYQKLCDEIINQERFKIDSKYILKPFCLTTEESPDIHSSEEISGDDSTKEQTVSESPIEGTEPLNIQFGSTIDNNEPVLWFPTDTNQTFNTNTGIIGTMGTGKTQFTKSLITQLIKQQKSNVNGTPIGVLIFDYKGDYIKKDFVKATNATVFDLAHIPFNPLVLHGNKPLQPVHTANLFKATLAKAFGTWSQAAK